MKNVFVAILVLLTSMQFCVAGESLAKNKYAEAAELFYRASKMDDWREREKGYLRSEELFKESFREWPHPQIAYFIAIVNYKIRDHAEVISFSQTALTIESPRIQERYIEGIKDLIRYSEEAIEASAFIRQQAKAGVNLHTYIKNPDFYFPEDNI